MTGSTPAALIANPAPSPETGLIGIRFKHLIFRCRTCSLNAVCHVTCREASNRAFCQAYEVCPYEVCQRANMQASALSIRFLDAGCRSIRSSSFRDYFLLKNILF